MRSVTPAAARSSPGPHGVWSSVERLVGTLQVPYAPFRSIPSEFGFKNTATRLGGLFGTYEPARRVEDTHNHLPPGSANKTGTPIACTAKYPEIGRAFYGQVG